MRITDITNMLNDLGFKSLNIKTLKGNKIGTSTKVQDIVEWLNDGNLELSIYFDDDTSLSSIHYTPNPRTALVRRSWVSCGSEENAPKFKWILRRLQEATRQLDAGKI